MPGNQAGSKMETHTVMHEYQGPMKHFSIWMDSPDGEPAQKRILLERDVLAPCFRDACSLVFGNHIWFDFEKLTFRGARLSGEHLLTPWEIARLDTLPAQQEYALH